MKGREKKALHTKTLAELASLLVQKREELVKTQMELSTNKIKNVHAGRAIRRDMAIIQTIIAEKEITNG